MHFLKNKINNLKIKTRINLLSVILCVLLIFIGALGLGSLDEVLKIYDQKSNTVDERQVLILELSREVQISRTWYNTMIARSFVADGNSETQKCYQSAKAALDSFNKHVEEYNQNVNSDKSFSAERKKNYIDEVAKLSDYVNGYADILEPASQNLISPNHKKDNLDSGIDATLMAQVKESVNNIDAQVENLISLADLEENEVLASAKKVDDRTLIILAVFLIIAVIIAFISANVISNSILKPIDALNGIAKKVAKGNLDITIRSNDKDEIGQLSNSFGEVVETFGTILDDMNSSFESMKNGDINKRIDYSGFDGEYVVISKNINEMLDTIIVELRSARLTAEAYAFGDFSYDCPRFPGDKAIVHERFDTLKEQLKEVNTSIRFIIKNIIDGNLDVEIDESKFAGDWKNLSHDLNTLVKYVAQPIRETEDALSEISKGNLRVKVNPDKYNGEFKKMLEDIDTTVTGLSDYVDEIADVLQSMANQNLNVTIDQEYLGNFAPIKVALNLIADNFNKLIKEIVVSADHVAIGSQSIADSSTSLAQGASEQAAAVEQLTETVQTTFNNTQKSVAKVIKANNIADAAKESASRVEKEMNGLLDAMQAISESSNNISNIIKVIDDIAFQTNILALNAAVEAARAGEFGKGFAVVAEEVRNLAARSQNSAKETANLIATSLEKVAHGSKIVDDTASTIMEMTQQIADISEISSDIVKNTDKQKIANESAKATINQISLVVANNTASSEEGAAAAEELASQAAVFKESVAKFTLRN